MIRHRGTRGDRVATFLSLGKKVVAVEFLQRLSSLSIYRFNMTVEERKSFQFKEWVEEHVLHDTLYKLRLNDPTGDIYATLEN